MVTIRYREISTFQFSPIFRVIISGASQTGKTHFAEQIIKRNLFKCHRCYYFHPDCHENDPVDWKLDIPVLFDSEFPTVETFMSMPENSCVVLDDLVEECFASKTIDYLFRVLSSKRKLHVILMSQRYYHAGRYSLSIRNSSNYHILMRCVNKSMMSRIATDLGLKQEVTKAQDYTTSQTYPYIFIDRNPLARANKCEVFIDVLGSTFVLVRGQMKYFLLAESEFKKCFDIIDSELAKHADSSEAALKSNKSALVGQEKKTKEQTGRDDNSSRNDEQRDASSNDLEPGRTDTEFSDSRNTDTGRTGTHFSDSRNIESGRTETNSGKSEDTESDTGNKRSNKWHDQKEFERKFRRALHKYKIRA